MSYANKNEVAKIWKYPGGEMGVRALGDSPENVRWDMLCSDDIMAFMLWLGALQENNFKSPDLVYVPYFPYGRQDRVAQPGDQTAVALVSSMLQLLLPDSSNIVTLDAHSGVSAEMNVISQIPLTQIKSYMTWIGRPIAALVSPDKGATGKTAEYGLQLSTPVITMGKVRDPETGKLTGFEYLGGPDPLPEGDLLITDDICDGGGTFLGVAKVLQAKYPDRHIHLWTTHGIYSKGLTPLLEVFNTIGSTDSWPEVSQSHRAFKVSA